MLSYRRIIWGWEDGGRLHKPYLRAFCVSCFSSLKNAILNWCLTNRSCKTQPAYIIHNHLNMSFNYKSDTVDSFRGLQNSHWLWRLPVQLFPSSLCHHDTALISLQQTESKLLILEKERSFVTPQNFNMFVQNMTVGSQLPNEKEGGWQPQQQLCT